MLNIYNTLTRQKEEFKSLSKEKVGLYTCGPTVYDYAHIGNLRTYVFEDILRRTLAYNGFNVNHVMNLTDLGHLTSDQDEGEDKMAKALKREGKPATLKAMKELGEFYAEKIKEDLKRLNILEPQTWSVASDHIKEQVDLLKRLEDKGYIYVTGDGVYFDTEKFPDYGRLGLLVDAEKDGKHSRIGINKEKKNPRDFALWKFNDEIGFESPWGKGFPGWHLECSAMSMKYLGESFDLHCGGVDLIPVHHTNEIAQSESATGVQFVRYWMHGGFLNLDGEKMAKSAGGFLTLNDLIKRGYDPLAYRFLTLQTHYRKPMSFSWGAMDAAQNGLEHLRNQIKDIQDTKKSAIDKEYKNKFLEKINDDLNVPQTLAVVQKLLKSDLSNENKLATILDFDKALGLDLGNTTKIDAPKDIFDLACERQKARQAKKWDRADELRKKISDLGFQVSDTTDGFEIKKI